MRLTDLAGRRVAIWGPGGEGLALADTASRLAVPDRLAFLADDPAAVSASALAHIERLGGELLAVGPDIWDDIDVLVRTAGVSRYRPEVDEAVASGVAHTTPTVLWFSDHKDRRVVAVTGTKGKSTTTALIHHLLTGFGHRAVLAGNMGVPLGDPLPALYDIGADQRVVVELSSHQTADLDISPELAVVTNLSPDHLPWHRGDVETYYRDKLNLLRHRSSMISVLNAGDVELRRRAAAAPNPVWFGSKTDAYRVAGSTIVGPDGPVVEAGDLQLRGAFNLDNCCAALTAVAAWGLVDEAPSFGRLLSEFEALSDRFEVVGYIGGVEFISDPLASNPAGAAAAVRAVAGRPLTLIVGGADRGVRFDELTAAVCAVAEPPTVVGVPDNGEAVAAEVRMARPTVVVAAASDLVEAVDTAVGLTPPGGVVLFAPGAPTPVWAGSYLDRSRAFKAAVAERSAPQ